MPDLIDLSTEFGGRVARRLQQESTIWLTTVGAELTPQPRPVWFLWDDGVFIILSEPHARKVAHVRRHDRVALHFNSDEGGDDIVVFTGRARVAAEPLSDRTRAAYLAKYREGIAGLGMTEAEMVARYTTVILVTPQALRGF